MIPFLEMEGTHAVRLAIGIAVFYGSFFLIFFRGRLLFRFLGFPVHVYSYRNPFDRTCVYCGHKENMYKTINGSHWEEMDSGYAGHRCSQKDAKEQNEALG